MPWTNYPQLIGESDEELAEHEKRLRGKATHSRVRLLRVLKAGTVRSLPQSAPLIGYSVRQLSRWWKGYRAGGLERLLEEKPRRGMASRLHSDAYAGLEEEMRAGRVATLEDARRYLAERWDIDYGSVNGVWWQLQQRGARPKTGRRRHAKSSPAAQEAFRRGFRGAGAGGRRTAGLGV